MTKIDIVSGFLGAGKTTLIKKLIAEAYSGEKLVLIENEFGEINIDGGFLKESGIEISEMSAGCICCSLVGDFNKALKDVEAQQLFDECGLTGAQEAGDDVDFCHGISPFQKFYTTIIIPRNHKNATLSQKIYSSSGTKKHFCTTGAIFRTFAVSENIFPCRFLTRFAFLLTAIFTVPFSRIPRRFRRRATADRRGSERPSVRWRDPPAEGPWP